MTSAQRDVDAVNEYVINDVIDAIRKDMQSDNVSTAPLDELKRLWRSKIPALATADLANDRETAALMANPFLADLGTIMRLPSMASGATDAAADNGNASASSMTLDSLLDDAEFAKMMRAIDGDDVKPTDAAATASTGTNAADDALLAGAVFSAQGTPATRVKIEPTIPQIDGGTGTNPATASTSTTAATTQPASLTGADRVDLGSSDDDSEVKAAVGGPRNDISDFIVCLYDGVKRTKTRNKLSLCDGVATVQGVDYVFRKGNGECDFATR